MFNLNKISSELNDVSVNIMEHSGYMAKIMIAERLSGNGVFNLPPGNPASIIPIFCLPGCPDAWIREVGSYVIPIDIESGFWFDWTMNDDNVGIIASVKGMNPITGQKIEKLQLEQYRDKCPIHNIDLSHGRYCEACGYKLPPQNYISYPNTKWLDGFMQPDGSVRQFFFTNDDIRDVASAVIGKENTVPAFGFAFFRTVKERFIQQPIMRSFGNMTLGMGAFNTGILKKYVFAPEPSMEYYTWSSCKNVDSSSTVEPQLFGASYSCQTNDNIDSGTTLTSRSVSSQQYSSSISNIRSVPVETKRAEKRLKMNESKSVSVGAGAKIEQELEVDTLPLSDWNPEPQAWIRLYFVFEEQLTDIVKNGGIRAIEDNKVGYLENVPVG